MKSRFLSEILVSGAALVAVAAFPTRAPAQGNWEITPESEQALARGLDWLARHQGPQGNWESNDLGLVSTGVLAFLASGNRPGVGRYGENVRRAQDYILRNAQPSGLLNISEPRHGMYNHGLSTFVLGQLYGMSPDSRISPVLDRAIRLIGQTQCEDGGWDYMAQRQHEGHDLSLVVMQALALRSAVDIGLDVPDEVVQQAISCVREHYTPQGCSHKAPEKVQKEHPGRFTYSKGGGQATVAMAAAGVVCLQEFAQYDTDAWRIEKNIQIVLDEIENKAQPEVMAREHRAPFDAYTLCYVSQALYQVGGEAWKKGYPRLRDAVVAGQIHDPDHSDRDGMWQSGQWVGGRPGELYITSAACLVLAIPNRYLPILQEGRIDTLRARYGGKRE
jgi:hypothetical protein